MEKPLFGRLRRTRHWPKARQTDHTSSAHFGRTEEKICLLRTDRCYREYRKETFVGILALLLSKRKQRAFCFYFFLTIKMNHALEFALFKRTSCWRSATLSINWIFFFSFSSFTCRSWSFKEAISFFTSSAFCSIDRNAF